VDPLSGALQSFYRAFHKSTIYPDGHPAVPEAIGHAAERLRDALAGRTRLILGVSRDHLLVNDEPLVETAGTLRSLAVLLHGLDVAAIEVRSGLADHELHSVVTQLGRARRDGFRGVELAEAVRNAGVENLRLGPIDYRALSFGDGVQKREEGDEEQRDVWANMCRILTDPASYGTGGSAVEDLADNVSAEIYRNEGVGIDGLRSELGKQAAYVRSLPEDRRDLVRQRMAGFVNALNPELRRDILRVAPGHAGESLSIMSELADELPDTELLEGLQSADRTGNVVPEELVILLNKLVRISRSRPAMASQLEATLERWGVSPDALRRGEESMQTAIEEVFQRRSRNEYNPEEYRDLLSALSRDEDPGGESPPGDPDAASAELSAICYRSPEDPLELRLQAAEIGVQLLNRPGGGDLRSGVYGFVGAHTDLLLDNGKLAAVHEATIAARADKLLPATPEPARTSAEGFLADFADTERVERVVARSCEEGEVSAEALSLLELGGIASLHAVLDRLGEECSTRIEEQLLQFAAGFETDRWERALAERGEQGWRRLKPVFPVLRTMPVELAVPMLQALFTHEEPIIRHEALVCLCEVDCYSSPERYARRALNDASPRVVKTAIRRLASVDTPESMELLGAFLADELRGASRSAETCRLAAEVLLERGDDGNEHLAAALRTLCASVQPREALLARDLVASLESRAEAPAVRDALARWRFSPARMVSGVLGQGRKR
jgi:hypothetical protein